MSNSDTFGYQIAIIGMAGRFPGAKDVDEFWSNLRDGVESVTFFSDEELLAAGVDPAILNDPNYVKAKPVLEDADLFDAAFFSFTPREAELMDPQHRLFFECAWEALEDACYNPRSYRGRIGVYGGQNINSYLLFNLYPHSELMEVVGVFPIMIGNDKDHLTTQTSYKLNLNGPSVTVQTACSTSLVAVHLACQSLLSGECDMALAGGISVTVPLKTGYFYQGGGKASPDGHCRAFDARAQGTIFGNGVGIVVLKRLEEALADRDHIYAIIKGSAINNDGAAKVGYTAPSVEGQAEVIAEALAVAGVDPETISYVETHGTGTQLGDPIEIAGLTKAFQTNTKRTGYCAIGSVKPNVGHLDAAAGVTGLIKATLALQHQQLPPSLNFETPNPKIDFARSPFYVNTALQPWQADGHPRLAGVSSFGIGGTNAHVVLEEAPGPQPSSPSRKWQLMLLSAKTETALEQATEQLATYLKEHAELKLADVAYTLQVGRGVFAHRRMVLCQELAEAVEALETLDPKHVITRFQEPVNQPMVFMFPGGGAQYARMGIELYEGEPVFREQVDRCVEMLKPHIGLDLRDVLYPNEEQAEEASRGLEQPSLALPALFVTEYALAKLWMSWGVRPQAMIGHSLGEYVAACLANVIPLEDALALVALRGRLFERLPQGSMLSVPLAEEEVKPLLSKKLSIAAINGPSSCVITGPTEAVREIEHVLTEQGLQVRSLHIAVAAHSEMVTPILGEFTAFLEKVHLHPPVIPYISNVTGTWITEEDATDPHYWAKHLRQTVRFAQGMDELLKDPQWVLLEVGPGHTLSALVKQHSAKDSKQVVLSSLRHPQDRRSDSESLFSTLGQLWLAGVQIDWPEFYADEQRHRVSLPRYPFERERYWIEPGEQGGAFNVKRKSLRKKQNIADWFYIPSWKRTMPPLLLEANNLSREVLHWLVFRNECALGSQIVMRLKQEGQDVVSVMVGEHFAALDEDTYTINPRRRDDYDALFEELRQIGKIPNMIIHLWNVTPSGYPPSGIECIEELEYRSFYSLLFLAQALGKQNIADPLQLEVVSNNMQNVTGAETLCPGKATLIGPCRVIPQEYPHITCRSIDVILPELASAQERKLADQLIAELVTKQLDSIIAYRGYDRWIQTFEPVYLDEAPEEIPRLRKEGVYLITGGLGGMGLVLAEYLARTVHARLILMGRSAFPKREEWQQWLATHGDQHEVSRKIRAIRAMEELGAEVLVASADVTDQEQMRSVVTQAYKQFGQIHGVIYASGVLPGGLIQLKTPQMAESILAPKVKGTLILDALLEDAPLDFFVLCSSLRAILGGPGHVDHCAANAFLDTFAHYHTGKHGTFTVAINWDSWQEVGQAANIETQPASQTRTPQLPHPKGFDHPLIDQSMSDSSHEAIYLTGLNPATHWILDEHRILMRTAVMPGTGYLEMARAAFEQYTQRDTIEMQEVVFVVPLIVRDDEQKEVRTTITREGDGFEFLITSNHGPGKDEGSQWQEHARGTIRHIDSEPAKKYELASIIKRLTRVEDSNATSLPYGPRWKNRKEVYVGQDEVLAVLELPEEFTTDLAMFKLHPALLDVAVGVGRIARPHINQEVYLPFRYKRLKMHAPLTRKIYSHIRYKENTPAGGDIVAYDVTILDENGTELVEIEEFTLKKVNSLETSQYLPEVNRQESAIAAQAETSTQRSTAEDGFRGGILSKEGIDVFSRILARNTLPQVLISTRDFPALIEEVTRALTPSRIEEEVEKRQVSKAAHPRPKLQSSFEGPRNESERILAQLWQGVLGIEQVGIHDNFFELGGDSVMAIQIISRANKAGLSLSVNQLFEYQTIGELAGKALGGSADSPKADTVNVTDLNAEAVLDPAIRPEDAHMEHVDKPGRIFLTGATGFLGVFLLPELLQQTEADIYCLVRAANVEEGKEKIQKNLEFYSYWDQHLASRIIPVPGDLSDALLGLSSEQFQALATDIDLIYHAGALVNWAYPYSALKAPNVLGTQEILRLASQTKVKPVHYISTLAVFPRTAYSDVEAAREDDSLDHSEGLRGGYAQSKWVAEKLLMEARSRGLPVCIYRLGRVVGHSQTGACQTNDLFWKTVKACIQAGSVPKVDTAVEMMPVDYVSKAIVHLSRQPESLGKAFHIFNHQPLRLSDLVHWMRDFSYRIEQVPYDVWQSEQRRLFESSSESDLQGLALLFPEEDMTSSRDTSTHGLRFDCQNTLDGLAGTSIVCPAIDDNLLHIYFSYFIRRGFLEAPRLKVEQHSAYGG